MALKTYVWHGPPTALDFWPAEIGEGTQPIYSGQLVPGRQVPVPLPDDLHQVQCLVAFQLLVLAPEGSQPIVLAEPPDAADPSTSTPARRKSKEPTDG